MLARRSWSAKFILKKKVADPENHLQGEKQIEQRINKRLTHRHTPRVANRLRDKYSRAYDLKTQEMVIVFSFVVVQEQERFKLYPEVEQKKKLVRLRDSRNPRERKKKCSLEI